MLNKIYNPSPKIYWGKILPSLSTPELGVSWNVNINNHPKQPPLTGGRKGGGREREREGGREGGRDGRREREEEKGKEERKRERERERERDWLYEASSQDASCIIIQLV